MCSLDSSVGRALAMFARGREVRILLEAFIFDTVSFIVHLSNCIHGMPLVDCVDLAPCP